MNEISKYRQAVDQPPRVMGQAAYRTIAAMKNKTERDWRGKTSLPANEMPSEPLREKLRLRLSELNDALQPAGDEAVKPDIVSVLATMASRAGDVTDAIAVQKIYAADLADMPLFAVRLACADFRQKRVGDGKWAPTQGEIRDRARKHAEPFVAERGDIIAILDARPLLSEPRPETDEERAAVIARVRLSVAAVHEASNFTPPHEIERLKKRKLDHWDYKQSQRDQAYRERHKSACDIRDEAQAALNAMTYAEAPAELSEDAIAVLKATRA